MTHPVKDWLGRFEAALAAPTSADWSALFGDECYWRDFVAVSWNIITLEGRDAIAGMARSQAAVGVTEIAHDESVQQMADESQGWFTFRTATARCRGHVLLREGRAQLKDSYVQFRDGEAFLVAAHISPYGSGSWTNHLPERDRKLLLHRRELDRWAGSVATRGVSCVPLSLYFKGSRVKAEIALVKGKKLHDKRDAIRERELKREADRDMRRKG